MGELDARLASCFCAAFPELDPAEVIDAAAESVPEWDSLRTIILVSVLEEEFDRRIPARDYERLRSYGAVRAYLLEG